MAETFAEADRVMTPLARQAAQQVHLCRPSRRQCGRQSRRRSSPNRDYSARRAGDRPGADPAPGRLRHRARFHDGTQPGRIRSSGRCRRSPFRGCAGSRQRSRPRNDPGGDERQRPHGGGVCSAGRNRAHSEDDQRLRRDRQRQQQPSGSHRRREQRSRAGHGSLQKSWLRCSGLNGESRLPHIDCGWSQQTATASSGAPASRIAPLANRRQH